MSADDPCRLRERIDEGEVSSAHRRHEAGGGIAIAICKPERSPIQ
jgi:hypothetical protein